MKTIAIYNMKGGVGKTTSAVNLSFMAATAGQRVLLWDLDPQAASSFAFRVRPQVEDFGRKWLERARGLRASIRQTDYTNLDLLPADFAYRKFDRFLDDLGHPDRILTDIFDAFHRDYDVLVLDCPAGFSLVIEGLFTAADLVLVPTIPTPLSVRTITKLLKWAERTNAPARMAAFFGMVDRRKLLHRRACEWATLHRDLFLSTQIPFASIVEQMSVRRAPLGVFAPREAATLAFAHLWLEVQERMVRRQLAVEAQRTQWEQALKGFESLAARLESADRQEPSKLPPTRGRHWPALTHTFDTDRGALAQQGYALELREVDSTFAVVLTATASGKTTDRTEVRIDSSWAVDILAGTISPLDALERRLGKAGPAALQHVHTLVGQRRLIRVDSQSSVPAVSPASVPETFGVRSA